MNPSPWGWLQARRRAIIVAHARESDMLQYDRSVWSARGLSAPTGCFSAVPHSKAGQASAAPEPAASPRPDRDASRSTLRRRHPFIPGVSFPWTEKKSAALCPGFHFYASCEGPGAGALPPVLGLRARPQALACDARWFETMQRGESRGPARRSGGSSEAGPGGGTGAPSRRPVLALRHGAPSSRPVMASRGPPRPGVFPIRQRARQPSGWRTCLVYRLLHLLAKQLFLHHISALLQ